MSNHDNARDEYFVLKNSMTYPPTPLSRHSTDSDDSLRALELSDGPSTYRRYGIRPHVKNSSLTFSRPRSYSVSGFDFQHDLVCRANKATTYNTHRRLHFSCHWVPVSQTQETSKAKAPRRTSASLMVNYSLVFNVKLHMIRYWWQGLPWSWAYRYACTTSQVHSSDLCNQIGSGIL